MVRITIRLIGKEKDRFFKRIELNPQSHIDELVKMIETTTKIPPQYQEITFRGKELPDSLYPLELMKDFEELVVKHARIVNWTEFNAFLSLAYKYKDRKTDHKAKENFGGKLREFNETFSSYLDTDEEQIRNAATHYFSLFFGDDPQNPSIQITFKAKTNRGAQGGLICTVRRSANILGTFYLKSHLRASSTDSSSHQSVDLRELFVYKVLELVNLGPVTHYLANVHYSRFGLYIATEEAEGFRTASDISMATVESYKLDLLREIFHLVDLRSNRSNYGLNKDGNLFIVDFQIGNHKKSAKSSLRSCINKAERVSAYKTCMEEWRLQEKIRIADNKIEAQKKLLSERAISSKASNSYREYLLKVEENILFVVETLGSLR